MRLELELFDEEVIDEIRFWYLLVIGWKRLEIFVSIFYVIVMVIVNKY